MYTKAWAWTITASCFCCWIVTFPGNQIISPTCRVWTLISCWFCLIDGSLQIRREAALKTVVKSSEGGYSWCPPEAITTTWERNPNACLQSFQLNRNLKPNFQKKKMLPEGFRTTCFLLSGSSDLEWNKASGVFIQAIKVLRCLCNLFFIPNGPRIADANVSLQYCYLTMSH